MNSIIKYFGGKNGMFKNIIEHFPAKGSYNTYIEPFGGSFGIGFHIPEDMIAPIEIYNDLEQNVYSLFKVLADEEKYERFKSLCDISTYNEIMREEFKEKLKDNSIDDVTRAFYFFYVNRTSFNGIGAFATTQIVRRKMSKSISDYLSAVERLPEIHQRLSKVIIANQDALKLMQHYDTENVFIYADQPYVQSTRGCTLINRKRISEPRSCGKIINVM